MANDTQAASPAEALGDAALRMARAVLSHEDRGCAEGLATLILLDALDRLDAATKSSAAVSRITLPASHRGRP